MWNKIKPYVISIAIALGVGGLAALLTNLSPGDVLIHAFASIVIYYTVKAVCPRRGTTETMGSLDS